MKTWTLTALLAVLAAPAQADIYPTVAGSDVPDASLLLVNGAIYTPTGWQEAMAVDEGAIVAVGTADEIPAWRGDATEVLDLGGAAVFPGFHDLYVHTIGGGLEQVSCTFRSGAVPDEILAAVAACVAEAEPGEWIRGGNWVAAVFAPGQQTREFLDRVSPDNPVLLTDESNHSMLVNSAALEAAGITADTPDPQNGSIDRDADGRPTGLFREPQPRWSPPRCRLSRSARCARRCNSPPT